MKLSLPVHKYGICSTSFFIRSWSSGRNQTDWRGWRQIDALDRLVANLSEPAHVRRERIDLAAIRAQQQAERVEDDRSWTIEPLVGQGIQNRQRAPGTQGVEESPEQATIGRFIEQVAEVARDSQVVRRATQVDGEQVAAQVVELGGIAAGRHHLPGHCQDRWHIHGRHAHVRVPGRESETPGRSPGTEVQNALTPGDQVVGSLLRRRGKPGAEVSNHLRIQRLSSARGIASSGWLGRHGSPG